MEYVCVELLDVGSYNTPTHPFVEAMKTEGIMDVRMMLANNKDDWLAMGYDISHPLMVKLHYLDDWINNPDEDEMSNFFL